MSCRKASWDMHVVYASFDVLETGPDDNTSFYRGAARCSSATITCCGEIYIYECLS